MPNFENEYKDYRQKVNFERNYKMLNSNSNNRRSLPESSNLRNRNNNSNNQNNVSSNNQYRALPDNYASRRNND